LREESRNDQANSLFGEKKPRIVLDSARVAHKYRGQFYAVAARFERQRKKKTQIAVSADLRRAIVRDISTGDLFGRMWGPFATTRGTRHRIGKGFEPDAGRIAQHKAGA
jgi:hypothetical protein